MESQPVFVGVDWGNSTNHVCGVDGSGKVLLESEFKHDGDGLSKLRRSVLALVDGDVSRLSVGIERPHGLVVESLLDLSVPVFALNPKQLSRFRDRFSMSGAKDDRRDARVLADSLRTDKRAFRRVDPDCDVVIELREVSRMQAELVREQVRASNRLRDQLLRYFPLFVEVTADPSEKWALALWKQAPTLKKARSTRKATFAALLKKHRIKRMTTTDLVTAFKKGAEVTTTAGTERASITHIAVLNEQLSLLNEQLSRTDKMMKDLLSDLDSETESGQVGEQSAVKIVQSMPGVGTIVASGLLAEAAKPLLEGDYKVLRMLCGVAPVTKSSGKRWVVSHRYGANARLKNLMYYFAMKASQIDPVSKAKYKALRARGHSHGRALRTVGDRLLNVLCQMIKTRQLFDATRRVAAA